MFLKIDTSIKINFAHLKIDGMSLNSPTVLKILFSQKFEQFKVFRTLVNHPKSLSSCLNDSSAHMKMV